MDCFNYPLDTETLLRKKRRLRKELLAQNPHPLQKRIAILGGSTTNEVADQLGLFLLQYGIQAEFYQSEYGQYWQDAMFGTPELDGFHPDVIYIHTNWRNIINFPTTATPQAEIDAMLNAEYSRFEQMWQALEAKFHCPVIQNNFDRPNYRLMGNRDIWDPHGRSNYLSRLNQRFYAYAAAHEDFYINDIDYLSADYGLTAWGGCVLWHMYKYAMCLDAIPSLANSVANIIKSLYGRNKKAWCWIWITLSGAALWAMTVWTALPSAPKCRKARCTLSSRVTAKPCRPSAWCWRWIPKMTKPTPWPA